MLRLTIVAVAAALLAMLATLEVVGAQAFPPQARTEQGDEIRTLYMVVFIVAAVVFVAVEIAIVYIIFRYRRRGDALPKQTHGNMMAEVVWTVTPAVIVIALFVYSFIILENVESSPDAGEPVETIDVLGRQWTWAFRYSAELNTATASVLPEGEAQSTLAVTNPEAFAELAPFTTSLRIDVEHVRLVEVQEDGIVVDRAIDGTVAEEHPSGSKIWLLFDGTETRAEERLGGLEEDGVPTPVVTVPIGKTVRFNLAAVDVIHSFYTPEFLYKLDLVPGRVHAMWVDLNEEDVGPEGVYYEGQCAEFCGREHARMLFTVHALPLDAYTEWFDTQLAEALERLKPLPEPPPGAEPAGEAASAAVGDPVRGQQLFFTNGCNVCHGDQGEGGIGLTIAGTALALEEVIDQYRNPRDQMPVFPPDVIPDEDIADTYAWLQTLPSQ
ncbi:MAG: c-type cytochrome [Chloroflexi bacterium]|nr:c-type cytochrome [Chloroflexota bacterium]